MSNLYLPVGWLDFEYIDSLPFWLCLILGKRQIGKTYGCLELMLKKSYYHILLRRTTTELDTISAAPDLNPYKVFEPKYHVGLFKQAKKLCRICDYALDEEGKAEPTEQRGIATSLAEIAHIRGFNGSAFTDLVLDEAVPEKGVITRKTEGEAFLNAYVTINGNRELEGKPPLRAWLLANTNRIDSPILESLNLIDDILYMRRKGKEQLLTDQGVLILQPDSAKVSELRKDTKLMQQISKKSDFYGMAMENEFAYDTSPYIKTMDIRRMIPEWSFGKDMFCWSCEKGFYICRAPFNKGAKKYEASRTGTEQLSRDWNILKQYYWAGQIFFADMKMLYKFKNIFGLS